MVREIKIIQNRMSRSLAGMLSLLMLVSACGEKVRDRNAFFDRLSAHSWRSPCLDASENTFYSLPLEGRAVVHQLQFDRSQMHMVFTSGLYSDAACTFPVATLATVMSTDFPRSKLPEGEMEVRLTPQRTQLAAQSAEAVAKLSSLLRSNNPLIVNDIPAGRFFDMPEQGNSFWMIPPSPFDFISRIELMDEKLFMSGPTIGWLLDPRSHKAPSSTRITFRP